MKSGAVLVLSVLLGCESEVSTPDGGSSECGGVATGTSAGGASNTPGAFDAVAACEETCSRPCVGDPLICGESCLAAITPNCEQEAFASYECSMWYCDPSCDAEELQSALFGCVNPFYCGHSGNDPECILYGTDCDCVAPCEEGHSSRIACSASGTCDCYFDGVLVATCSDDSTYLCDFQSSCCSSYLRPGGGPAAGGE